MATSFNVNKHDLEYILKQIKIAEVHASGTPLLQAIQAAYGVTANDAALLPAGLRTVDGSFNNLLPGRSQIGAADTLFPRLTDPVYLNDTDGDQMPLGPSGSGAPTITNNNYGTPGSVADADPRIISNLIVDMTAGNPAAVAAALAYVGITGAAANTARSIITAAHKNIATTAAAAVAAQSAEMAALALKNTETGEQAAAAGANINAQATLGAYNAALALDVEVKMAAVQVAVDAWVTSLGGIGSVINVAVQAAAINAINIATTASQAAADAAALLLADLGATHPDVIAAQAVANDAAALLTQLTALQLALSSASPDLDTSEFNAAATANTLAGTNAIDANANTAQLTASQTDASTAATTTALALSAANSAVTQDTTDRNNATAASNAADAAIIAAQNARIPIAAAQVTATTAHSTAVTNNQPTGLTLSAYNAAVGQNLDTVTDTAKTAVAALVTSLGAAGSLIDGGDVLEADAAVGAALTASNAAAAAVAALSDPNVAPDDLANAQAVAGFALTLWNDLTTLRNNLNADVTVGDQVLDLADFTAAGSANTLASNNAAAGLTLDGQLGASQAAAVIANQPTADALAIAAGDLAAANIALSFADDAITGAITFANAQQLAENTAIADLAASVLIQTAALAADLAAQATLAAYTAALAEDAEVKAAAAQTEAGELVTSLGAIGATVDAADHLAATEAVAAASAASTAAANAANLLLAMSSDLSFGFFKKLAVCLDLIFELQIN